MDIASMIDQSLLKPDVIRQQVEQLCVQGREYGFITIVVNPVWVRYCKDQLEGTGVMVCTVSGFPLGASKPEIKAKEAEIGVRDGADEIDMVMNIGAFKTGNLMLVEKEIKDV
ncbi:MAG: deoxyribose-phosphate aldolase, partial [Candidatus Zixiibacteriota bacterium]